jgi:hypothetical protein
MQQRAFAARIKNPRGFMVNESYKLEMGTLSPEEFIHLAKAVGWGPNRQYEMIKVAQALKKASQGSSKLSPFTERMTGMKVNDILK